MQQHTVGQVTDVPVLQVDDGIQEQGVSTISLHGIDTQSELPTATYSASLHSLLTSARLV